MDLKPNHIFLTFLQLLVGLDQGFKPCDLQYFIHFSLHMTTMCLRFPPTVVACVCIHLACKWSKYSIPLSTQKKEWFSYIDSDTTHELLEKLTGEFLAILDKSPSRLRRKMTQQASVLTLLAQMFPFDFWAKNAFERCRTVGENN